MRRTIRLSVDQLEGKALLSGFVGPIQAPTAPAAPTGVTASVVVSKPTIAPQGSVNFSLVETNNTTHSVTISVPASKEVFEVFQGGLKVWQSPPPLSQIAEVVTIAPGQSATIYSATWNDTSNAAGSHTANPTGTFSVVSEFDTTATPGTVTVTAPGSTGTGTPTSPVFTRNPPKIHPTFG